MQENEHYVLQEGKIAPPFNPIFLSNNEFVTVKLEFFELIAPPSNSNRPSKENIDQSIIKLVLTSSNPRIDSLKFDLMILTF